MHTNTWACAVRSIPTIMHKTESCFSFLNNPHFPSWGKHVRPTEPPGVLTVNQSLPSHSRSKCSPCLLSITKAGEPNSSLSHHPADTSALSGTLTMWVFNWTDYLAAAESASRSDLPLHEHKQDWGSACASQHASSATACSKAEEGELPSVVC